MQRYFFDWNFLRLAEKNMPVRKCQGENRTRNIVSGSWSVMDTSDPARISGANRTITEPRHLPLYALDNRTDLSCCAKHFCLSQRGNRLAATDIERSSERQPTMKYSQSPLNHGYANRILTIDLNEGTIDASKLDPRVRDFFIGGRGLGLYMLHRRVTAEMTAYDPGNPLISKKMRTAWRLHGEMKRRP